MVNKIGEIIVHEKIPTQVIQTRSYHIFRKRGKKQGSGNYKPLRLSLIHQEKKISRRIIEWMVLNTINVASFLSTDGVTCTVN